MKRLRFAIVLLALTSLPGCSWYDYVFPFLGEEHYTGGGTTWDEKKDHYDEQVRAWGGNP